MVMSETLSLSCKSLRIGSYEFSPKFKIKISASKVQLVVPSVKDLNKVVTINIELEDIIRVLANLDQKPLIFLLLKADACKNIREALKMKRKKEYFLDVKSKEECQKRICLVPNFLSPKEAEILRATFKNLLQEIDIEMAKQIYNLSKPKVCLSPVKSDISENSDDIQPQTKTKKADNPFLGGRIDALAIRKQMEEKLSNNALQKVIYKKEIIKFNFDVAEIVKKYLSRYYKPRKLDPKMYKITTKAEYSNLAKMFSHQFREEISRQYFKKNSSFKGVVATKSDEMDIKIQIEINLKNRLKLSRNEFVGYSVLNL